jgi:hypothetical protein
MPFAMINDWRALSLRRLSHLDQMKRTGRWRGAFSSESMLDAALREAEADAARWKELAEASRAAELAEIERRKAAAAAHNAAIAEPVRG